MVVNDDVGYLTLCGGLAAAIAGKPAPTGWGGCGTYRQKWDPIHKITANFSASLATKPSRHNIDG
ncbi:hypothetical protein FIV38_06200 [Pseudomonas proteolytica]|nr:hypothetical protein F4W61_04205 [Pseudomonas proteolytica]TWR84648.1 hypothetical protein FIV38_06200 [Pseudomonas proteolytica]